MKVSEQRQLIRDIIERFSKNVKVLFQAVVEVVRVTNGAIAGILCPDHAPEMIAIVFVPGTAQGNPQGITRLIVEGESGAIEVIVEPSATDKGLYW